MIADDDGVARVVAALVAHDIVDATTEQVGSFPFALIAPLGTEENDRWHRARLVAQASSQRHPKGTARKPRGLDPRAVGPSVPCHTHGQ